jgi:hypothetical protein
MGLLDIPSNVSAGKSESQEAEFIKGNPSPFSKELILRGLELLGSVSTYIISNGLSMTSTPFDSKTKETPTYAAHLICY